MEKNVKNNGTLQNHDFQQNRFCCLVVISFLLQILMNAQELVEYVPMEYVRT